MSGIVDRNERRQIIAIRQERTDKRVLHPSADRDAGLYVFHNTEEFRKLLSAVRNDNVRQEYMFADVVSQLSKCGWIIEEAPIDPEYAVGINTVSELLSVFSAGESDFKSALRGAYGLTTIDPKFEPDGATLLNVAKSHDGPLFFFPDWDRQWS